MDLYSQLANSLAPNFAYLGVNGVAISPFDTENIASSQFATDFPLSDDPVYILGRKYSSLHELAEIRADVRSLIWITYRRNFPPIGDTGYTSDAGWGCMLRAGQMVMAAALCKLHLGRDWRWHCRDTIALQQLYRESFSCSPSSISTKENHDNTKEKEEEAEENEEKTDATTNLIKGQNNQTKTNPYEQYCQYRRILKLFADRKTASYSIHQIALMGVCEGKEVGQWFGPNTVAQVLKKLSLFDKMNDVHIHIAMDNMIFIDDIKKFCKSKIRLESIRMQTKANEALDLNQNDKYWRPLLLFIPLRLGLTEINPIYFRALKSTFAFPQTLGILGGRPNHALYLIGCCGDHLIYLDPHTTQSVVNLVDDPAELVVPVDEELPNESTTSSEAYAEEGMSMKTAQVVTEMDDVSYHCESGFARMPIHSLDPSLSLCFLCRTEEEFDQWANLIMKKLINNDAQPLFEIMKERPANWPLFEEDFELQPPTTNKDGVPTSAVVTINGGTPTTAVDTAATSTHWIQPTLCNNPSSASNISAQNSFVDLESDEDFEIID